MDTHPLLMPEKKTFLKTNSDTFIVKILNNHKYFLHYLTL